MKKLIRLVSATVAATMVFAFSGNALPAATVEAKSVIKDRIMCYKVYNNYDINGDGINDTLHFYAINSDKKNSNICTGWNFFVTLGGGGYRKEIQTITIDNKVSGKYYYNIKATKPKETVTEVYMVRLKNGKSYLAVNYYSKKGKYRDTHFYYHQNGRWLNKRAKNRRAYYKLAAKSTNEFKNTGIKNLTFKTVTKNSIKYEGSFSNKQIGPFTADVYYGYKSKSKLVPYTANGKQNKDHTVDVKAFRHYTLVTDKNGNKKIKTSQNSDKVTVRNKLALYKDAAFSKPLTDDATGEAITLARGEKVKVTKIYLKGKKYAIFVKSDKGSGYVTLADTDADDLEPVTSDKRFFEESVKPTINDDIDEPETGDEEPSGSDEDTDTSVVTA